MELGFQERGPDGDVKGDGNRSHCFRRDRTIRKTRTGRVVTGKRAYRRADQDKNANYNYDRLTNSHDHTPIMSSDSTSKLKINAAILSSVEFLCQEINPSAV